MIWDRVKAGVVGALVGASTPAQAEQVADPGPGAGPRRAPSEVATDPQHPSPAVPASRQPDYERPRGGCGTPGGPRFRPGLKFTASKVFTKKAADGYGGRVEIDLPNMPLWVASPIFGFAQGIEGWGSKDGGGGGLPFNFYLGAGSPNLFATAGFGWEWLIFDRVHDRNGFAFFAPFASATAGVWINRFRLAADGRAIYRWHIGDIDRRQYTAGLSLLYMPR